MIKVGVLLSGCGNRDGAEIHESTLTLLYLAKAGAAYLCMAPGVDFPADDYLTGKPSGETRNALAEAARIARGDIRDLAGVRATDMDALIIPGGLGAIKVLSDFAAKGPDCAVLPDVARLVGEVHAAGKPIGAICIAPVILAKCLGSKGPELTIGTDMGAAGALAAMGARHRNRAVDEICVDGTLKLVTTPAYMLGPGIADIATGIEKCVAEVLRLAGA